MKLAELTRYLEEFAPLNYQEDYDNSGLLCGNPELEITGVLIALDCTEAIVEEAVMNRCNVILTHHPLVFKGLKRLTGGNYVERTLLKAIQNGIALYAAHTNLDSVQGGVNGMICNKLGLQRSKILVPRKGILKKLVTFCPVAQAEVLRSALFAAGAGKIGAYGECSFNISGTGTFLPGAETSPFAGSPGIAHQEQEIRIETVFPVQLERKVLLALLENHPYEEVAYDIYALENNLETVGTGMCGWLEEEMDASDFLNLVKERMQTGVIRHTRPTGKKIKKVAVCGGSGSFLLQQAIAAGADAFVTADFKYHEFFDADGKIMITDIGHYESEQFTSDLLRDLILMRFPGLSARKTTQTTNPVSYFV
ncbi:Nif3-like dinuclear metal center hexameric protein [Pedobacter antarcticus]|uniref:Nif3-like dinuclear metal center hexameric protein n=1 Tax=Pedobacter antarcticus TaxID=34086 RepID=UPI001C5743A4|nr:Nif3-like dinuclear metal center hexameric protein [Pedobacter antarcticus]